MFVGGFNVAGDLLHVLLEILDEFFVFLISPGGTECMQLCAERSHSLFEFRVEFSQILGKPPQFDGIDDGLGHKAILRCSTTVPLHLL